MTPTPRERFEEEFWHIDEMMMIPPKEMILEFVDALLEEARQDTKKEFIKFVKEETSFPKMRLLDREDLLKFLSL